MKSFIIGVICCVCSIPAFAQDRNAEQIQKILAEQQASWNRGDLKAFMQGYLKTDSLMFIGKTGVTYGWQKTLQNYIDGYPNNAAMGNLQFDIIQVKKLSKRYYSMVGKWMLKRSIGDVSGHFTLIWQKIDGEWKIIMDHSS